MSAFAPMSVRFVRAIRDGLGDPVFRAILIMVVLALTTGTIFYSLVEHWSVLDSLYFCVITLATVGYGDLHPTKPISKLFTIFYVLVGIGLIATFAQQVARRELERQQARTAAREQARRQAREGPPTTEQPAPAPATRDPPA